MSFVSFDSFSQTVALRPWPRGKALPAFSVAEPDDGFVPPTIDQVDDGSAADVILVSARGATGKTMSARELSQQTSTPLWSLQDDRAVSADALPARLTEFLEVPDPMAAVRAGELPGLIIDSMDEARTRVTGQSWYEFMGSLAEFARAGLRLVIFGRKRTVEEVWSDLEELRVSTAMYEISHFDTEQQTQYVDIKALEGREPTQAYVDARNAVLASLRASGDVLLGDTFVGYAPVLDAVAALVDRRANHLTVATDFGPGAPREKRIAVLERILVTLLKRDQPKVARLAHDLEIDPQTVYTPEEQLDWVAHHLLGTTPPTLDWCLESVRADYVEQLRGFRKDHPFVSGQEWASPVFASFVAARRFHAASPELLRDIGNSSGLLFEFLVCDSDDSQLTITEPQLAALQASLLAGEWLGTDVTVVVRGEGNSTEEVLSARAHLHLCDEGHSTRFIEAEVLLDRPAMLELASPLVSTDVVFPGRLVIRARESASLNLGPDVRLRAQSISLVGSSLQVSRSAEGAARVAGSGVEIEALEEFDATTTLLGKVPTGDLTIAVPQGAKLAYPWVNYRVDLYVDEGPEIGDRVRRLLDRLMSLVRRHGHGGERGVFVKKWEGRQGLKSEDFRVALGVLKSHGVISEANEMIFLSQDWERFRYDGKSRPGLPSYQDHSEVWDPILAEITEALT